LFPSRGSSLCSRKAKYTFVEFVEAHAEIGQLQIQIAMMK
jgi:hypothetical protein